MLAIPKVIQGAMGSAAGAEVAAIHMGAKEAVPTRQCLGGVGHPQPATRARASNAAAKGFVNGATKQKRSEAFGRRFWWLKDRGAQLQPHAIGALGPAT